MVMAKRVGFFVAALAIGLGGCGDHEPAATGSGGTGGGGSGPTACYVECEGQAANTCSILASVQACQKICDTHWQLSEACGRAQEAKSQCRVDNGDPCGRANPDPCADKASFARASCSQ